MSLLAKAAVFEGQNQRHGGSARPARNRDRGQTFAALVSLLASVHILVPNKRVDIAPWT